MRFRLAAVLAAVLIPLLALGTGVFIAAGRSSPTTAPQAKSGPSRVAEWLEEGRVNAPAAPKPLETAAATPVDRARLRYEITTCLARIRYVGGRSSQCKELWPMASTEEEGRALQREKVALD
ncbi:MAG TPA: hypothetical protein VJU16_08145, partial [Planctomycetota bacterium]|nr:hypothetical protein [Planctomycetota bacterium]